MENYELLIKKLLKENIKNIELISNTNNIVYKIITDENKILFAKFYQENSTHIDNELKLYNLIDNKYLKEIYYKFENPKMAIFKELTGKTIDELTEKEIIKYSKVIISNICDYFNSISKHKIEKYGILDENLKGTYNDFHLFLKKRQNETSKILKDYQELNNIFTIIYNKYKDIIKSDNSLIPIDTNLKNIMITKENKIKFIDPGEMISGPILMAYGDLVAHIYKTPLYTELIKQIKPNKTEEILIRIYAILSSLNILAFLKKHGINELYQVIPYGNKYTFYHLIKEHLEHLNIKI